MMPDAVQTTRFSFPIDVAGDENAWREHRLACLPERATNDGWVSVPLSVFTNGYITEPTLYQSSSTVHQTQLYQVRKRLHAEDKILT